MKDEELRAIARTILGENHVCDDWEMEIMRAIAAAERERIAKLCDKEADDASKGRRESKSDECAAQCYGAQAVAENLARKIRGAQ